MSRVRFFGFEVGNDNIAVAAVGMWKSRRFAISKGGGKREKTCFWFSSLSTARHFHGRSCRPNALATVGYPHRWRSCAGCSTHTKQRRTPFFIRLGSGWGYPKSGLTRASCKT